MFSDLCETVTSIHRTSFWNFWSRIEPFRDEAMNRRFGHAWWFLSSWIRSEKKLGLLGTNHGGYSDFCPGSETLTVSVIFVGREHYA